MANVVIVAGGWHGGCEITPFARKLRALGHEVFTPTLTGLGERAHLAAARPNLDTHILDVATCSNSRPFRCGSLRAQLRRDGDNRGGGSNARAHIRACLHRRVCARGWRFLVGFGQRPLPSHRR